MFNEYEVYLKGDKNGNQSVSSHPIRRFRRPSWLDRWIHQNDYPQCTIVVKNKYGQRMEHSAIDWMTKKLSNKYNRRAIRETKRSYFERMQAAHN